METPTSPDELVARFETHRGQLRAVARRMLGTVNEAEDAVQEAWLRLSRADTSEVGNLGGWLTTVVSRICLDLLRSRTARREVSIGARIPEPVVPDPDRIGPEDEAILTDSVSRALLVVLERLSPTERVAFVLHDLFAVPFDKIAPIVDRSPAAAKKLASRARHRVKGTTTVPAADLAQHRQVVDAFIEAARGRDLDGLLALLAPDVVRRADPAALRPGMPTEVRGARAVAEEAPLFTRRAELAEVAVVDGDVGIVIAPRGRLLYAITLTIEDGKVAAYEAIADPARLERLDLAVLDY